jgi:hypothetical protein
MDVDLFARQSQLVLRFAFRAFFVELQHSLHFRNIGEMVGAFRATPNICERSIVGHKNTAQAILNFSYKLSIDYYKILKLITH